jgi:hypothetical protein
MSLITFYKTNHGRSVFRFRCKNTSFNAFMDLGVTQRKINGLPKEHIILVKE